MITGLRMESSGIILDGYPVGTTVHGIDSPEAHALRRMFVFMNELRQVGNWLCLIPADLPTEGDATHVATALADAALITFCRCFDVRHPLKPLKTKKLFTPKQRDQFERLKNIRNKMVAHDDNPSNGVFSLITRSVNMKAVEAVSISLNTPFVVFQDLNSLRILQDVAFKCVAIEHERVATEIVRNFVLAPLSVRASAPPFEIKVDSKDLYAPTVQRVPKA